MIAFKDLSEVLKITLAWEHKLRDFYDVAEIALSKDESKATVALLRERLLGKLEVLEQVDISKFGRTEWIRYAPDVKGADLIPVGRIRRDTSPAEIFAHLLDYESKLRTVYAGVADNLISRTQKELFQSLVLFKEEQIQEIQRLMDRA